MNKKKNDLEDITFTRKEIIAIIKAMYLKLIPFFIIIFLSFFAGFLMLALFFW